MFAILELLRAVAAFMIAPILLHFATTLTGLPTPAMSTALWICFGLSAGGALIGVAALPARRGAAGGAVADPGSWVADEPGVGFPAAAGRDPPDAGQRRAAHIHGRTEAASCTPRPSRSAGPVRLRRIRPGRGRDRRGGRQLRAGRDALVLTIWEPFNVGFLPVDQVEFDAAEVDEVRKAAEQTAAHGAALAEAAGFRAQSMAAEAAPTWQGIIDAADEHDASLIVLGSHGRSGLAGAVAGQRRRRGRGAFPAVRADRAPALSWRPGLAVRRARGLPPPDRPRWPD